MGKKSKQRIPSDRGKVKKHVFLVSSPRMQNFAYVRKTSLRLFLGFKDSLPVTPGSYEFISKLLKQKIRVQASLPTRHVEESDELSAACTGATKTWIENHTKEGVLRGQELNRHLDSFLKAGPSSTNVLSSSNVLSKYDSRPRATLSQDQLFQGVSPSVGNIKGHPDLYPPRQEEGVCQEPTMKGAVAKPRVTVQHCQKPITKQIRRLLLQKHKAKSQRTRKSHTWQETKPNLGKEGRTVASETPQVRKKKNQTPCYTGVPTSGRGICCPQRKKGTWSANSVHKKGQKMGPSTPVTPSEESEKICVWWHSGSCRVPASLVCLPPQWQHLHTNVVTLARPRLHPKLVSQFKSESKI